MGDNEVNNRIRPVEALCDPVPLRRYGIRGWSREVAREAVAAGAMIVGYDMDGAFVSIQHGDNEQEVALAVMQRLGAIAGCPISPGTDLQAFARAHMGFNLVFREPMYIHPPE